MNSPKHSSKRKPHNQDAGYIAERKFYDSHIVIYNAEAQGIDVAPCKYAIVCSQHGAICSASSVPQSRQSMKNPEFCEECMKAEQWANRKSPRFQKALQIARTQPAPAAPQAADYNPPLTPKRVAQLEELAQPQPAKAAQDSPLVELGRAAVTAEAELERVRQQLKDAIDSGVTTIRELQQQRDTAQMYLESAEAQRDKAEQLNSELLAALKGVAGDSIAMRGFHEAFRNQVRAAIARAEEAAS